jgi:hypothetical protein
MGPSKIPFDFFEFASQRSYFRPTPRKLFVVFRDEGAESCHDLEPLLIRRRRGYGYA